MGWKNWDIDMTLLCYRGKWYHTTDDMRQGRSVSHEFDVVIEVTGNEFNVTKDRHNANTGTNHPNSDMFRVQLFASGRTLYDLPTFTKSSHVMGHSVIGYRDSGELFEYTELRGPPHE